MADRNIFEELMEGVAEMKRERKGLITLPGRHVKALTARVKATEGKRAQEPVRRPIGERSRSGR